MRFRNLSYMHTNRFDDDSYDIQLSAEFSHAVLDTLGLSDVPDNENPAHISIWMDRDFNTDKAYISDGWVGGAEVELTYPEYKEVMAYLEDGGILRELATII